MWSAFFLRKHFVYCLYKCILNTIQLAPMYLERMESGQKHIIPALVFKYISSAHLCTLWSINIFVSGRGYFFPTQLVPSPNLTCWLGIYTKQNCHWVLICQSELSIRTSYIHFSQYRTYTRKGIWTHEDNCPLHLECIALTIQPSWWC